MYSTIYILWVFYATSLQCISASYWVHGEFKMTGKRADFYAETANYESPWSALRSSCFWGAVILRIFCDLVSLPFFPFRFVAVLRITATWILTSQPGTTQCRLVSSCFPPTVKLVNFQRNLVPHGDDSVSCNNAKAATPVPLAISLRTFLDVMHRIPEMYPLAIIQLWSMHMVEARCQY